MAHWVVRLDDVFKPLINPSRAGKVPVRLLD